MPILIVLETTDKACSLKVVDSQGELALDMFVCSGTEPPPEVVVVQDVVGPRKRTRTTLTSAVFA